MSENKESRQALIRELISEQQVPNQDALLKLLAEAGFAVTQSSVSRDLAELGVEKTGGHYRLPVSGEASGLGILSAVPAGPNLLVLKTAIGAAPLAGVKLDALGLPQVIGTISGDDTIFLATADALGQQTVLKQLGLGS